jgi:hypothetical protein
MQERLNSERLRERERSGEEKRRDRRYSVFGIARGKAFSQDNCFVVFKFCIFYAI